MTARCRAAGPVVERRRRGFGLDEARRPSPERAEREVLAWLAARLPAALPVRSAGEAEPHAGRALTLLLPRGRVAVLWFAGRHDDADPRLRGLADACRSRAVPLGIVRGIDDARAALRRLGLEPERP